MNKTNYSIDANVLSINTECGEYKFKIDGEFGLTIAKQIADRMVAELENVEAKFVGTNEKSSPYAKLLLSNLNLSDRYIRLENKYKQLLREHEELKALQESQEEKPAEMADKSPLEPKQPEPPKDHKLSREPALLTDTKPEVDQNRLQVSLPPTPAPEIPAMPEQPSPDLPAAPEKTEAPVDRHLQAEHQDPSRPIPLVEPVIATKADARLPERSGISSQSGRPPEPKAPQEIPKPENIPDSNKAPAPQITSHEKALAVSGPQLKINTTTSKRNSTHKPVTDTGDDFRLPPLDFLKKTDQALAADHEAIRRDAELLEQKFGYFGIQGEVMEVSPGPVITTFEYKPAPGIKISKIVNLADDLALALSALSIRLVAPIPGKDVVGIEIPNPQMSIVPFVDIVGSDEFVNSDSHTPICLGKDIIGNPVVVGLEKMPHLLIAGATGTGKSVALNAMIASILYKSTPEKVQFIMIDPKRIELSLFNDIPHLITPVITDMKKANIALQWVVREMERRYEKLAGLQVRNTEQYNHKIKSADLSAYGMEEPVEAFPYIVVIIDELADLMMTASKDIEFSLTRLAQMARAAGIHLILATQRPSVDVLTGIIKANFPTRISFQVSSKTDSRTIIDANGAETLLGRGDMLFVPPGTARLQRVHGTFLSEKELVTITDFIKAQGKPDYIHEVTTEREEVPATATVDEDDYDEKYQAALEYVLGTRQASISSVQRALRIGYNRAARIIDLMEKRGIVGASEGVKPRRVLVDRLD